MSPYKSPAKPITPQSVKILMILEALVLGFLSSWMINEYMNNIFMQEYVNTVFGAHITTYTMMIGLGIGLGGTAIAALFYRNLRDARTKLERMPSPRLKATVKQALSTIPLIDEETALDTKATSLSAETTLLKTDTAQQPDPTPAPQPAATISSKSDEPQDKS